MIITCVVLNRHVVSDYSLLLIRLCFLSNIIAFRNDRIIEDGRYDISTVGRSVEVLFSLQHIMFFSVHLAYLAHFSKFGVWDSKKKVDYHRLRHGLRHPQEKVIHSQVLPVNSTKV